MILSISPVEDDGTRPWGLQTILGRSLLDSPGKVGSEYLCDLAQSNSTRLHHEVVVGEQPAGDNDFRDVTRMTR